MQRHYIEVNCGLVRGGATTAATLRQLAEFIFKHTRTHTRCHLWQSCQAFIQISLFYCCCCFFFFCTNAKGTSTGNAKQRIKWKLSDNSPAGCGSEAPQLAVFFGPSAPWRMNILYMYILYMA